MNENYQWWWFYTENDKMPILCFRISCFLCLPFKLGRSGAAHIQMDYYSVRSDAESRTVYSVLYECVVKSVLVSKLRKWYIISNTLITNNNNKKLTLWIQSKNMWIILDCFSWNLLQKWPNVLFFEDYKSPLFSLLFSSTGGKMSCPPGQYSIYKFSLKCTVWHIIAISRSKNTNSYHVGSVKNQSPTQ